MRSAFPNVNNVLQCFCNWTGFSKTAGAKLRNIQFNTTCAGSTTVLNGSHLKRIHPNDNSNVLTLHTASYEKLFYVISICPNVNAPLHLPTLPTN